MSKKVQRRIAYLIGIFTKKFFSDLLIIPAVTADGKYPNEAASVFLVFRLYDECGNIVSGEDDTELCL
ncbi:MAG TPA: hypothetical protein VLB68_25965 [Pyrinomonadaceae bacterium]|nr:hypothetical protein [Pyrinomonadaceae bacterium]